VINRKAPEGQYVTRWEQMDFLPGTSEAIRLLNKAGYFVVVVSNHRCVAKGLISASDLESMHGRMLHDFAAAGARIDAIYYCPHEMQPPCACRKPEPGMLLDAAREHQLDLSASWMIGDSTHDVEAGRRAGCKTARLIGEGNSVGDGADVIASSLLRATEKILETQSVSAG